MNPQHWGSKVSEVKLAWFGIVTLCDNSQLFCILNTGNDSYNILVLYTQKVTWEVTIILSKKFTLAIPRIGNVPGRKTEKILHFFYITTDMIVSTSGHERMKKWALLMAQSVCYLFQKYHTSHTVWHILLSMHNSHNALPQGLSQCYALWECQLYL